MGQIPFDTEKGLVQFDMHGALPSIESAYIGVKRIGTGAAVANIDISFGYLRFGFE